MRRVLRLIAVNFAVLSSILVLVVVGVPLVAQLAGLFASDPTEARSNLPNYAGLDWVGQHFREINATETVYHSFVGWRRDHFAGETINIEGPFFERRTAQPPGATTPSVFFFGGSTVWGTGVRDQETIPSLYATASGRQARNFGEWGYTAHQGLEMLLWLLQSGERPDVVVFYDGVNDVAHKCVRGRDAFSHAQESKIRQRLEPRMASPEYFLAPVLQWLAELTTEESAEGSDCDEDPAKAQAVAEALVRDWDAARLIAEANGIRFYAVLQPVIYFSQTRGDHLPQKPERDQERQRQFAAVYPRVQALMAERGYADFTGVLDVDDYVYIDFCHLSPNGNALVAAAMAELIE